VSLSSTWLVSAPFSISNSIIIFEAFFVEFLLERKSDVNSKDKNGRTPLLWACKGNHFKIVLSLIKKGAETNMTGRDGWSPLMEACKNASKMIIELLIEKGADTNHVLLKDTNVYGRFEN
jgi:ankyrin repeat protein